MQLAVGKVYSLRNISCKAGTTDFLGQMILCCGPVFCIVGCLTASLASAYYVPTTISPPPACSVRTKNVFWGTKSPQLKTIAMLIDQDEQELTILYLLDKLSK